MSRVTDNQNNLADDPDRGEEGVVKASPICPEYSVPVSELAYYCPHCGAASGQLTPIMLIALPFVLIEKLHRKH